MLFCRRSSPNSEKPHQKHAVVTRMARPQSRKNRPEMLWKTQVTTGCHLCFSSTYAMLPTTKNDHADLDDNDRGRRPLRDNRETTSDQHEHQKTTKTLPTCFPPTVGAFKPQVECLPSSIVAAREPARKYFPPCAGAFRAIYETESQTTSSCLAYSPQQTRVWRQSNSSSRGEGSPGNPMCFCTWSNDECFVNVT